MIDSHIHTHTPISWVVGYITIFLRRNGTDMHVLVVVIVFVVGHLVTRLASDHGLSGHLALPPTTLLDFSAAPAITLPTTYL